jgi:hypothetical protein
MVGVLGARQQPMGHNHWKKPEQERSDNVGGAYAVGSAEAPSVPAIGVAANWVGIAPKYGMLRAKSQSANKRTPMPMSCCGVI